MSFNRYHQLLLNNKNNNNNNNNTNKQTNKQTKISYLRLDHKPEVCANSTKLAIDLKLLISRCSHSLCYKQCQIGALIGWSSAIIGSHEV